MASYKFLFVFFFFFIHFLYSPSTEAADATYLNHYCATNKTFIDDIDYQINLSDLLYFLSSNATGETEFYNTTVAGAANARNPPNTVYGLFMCSGYVSPQLCHQCVRDATAGLSFDYCSYSKEAIIWYDECLVRYSNRSFFSTVDARPRISQSRHFYVSNQLAFERLLFHTMNATADEAAKRDLGEKKYATKQANISGSQSLYCVAQCTPDLSSKDCRNCLSDAIGELPLGGRVLYPSCNVRSELYHFYRSVEAGRESFPWQPTAFRRLWAARDSPWRRRESESADSIAVAPTPYAPEPQEPQPQEHQGKRKGHTRRTIVIVVVCIVVAVILICLGCYFLWRSKMRKINNGALRKNNSGRESIIVESLQFNLATIEAATNNFSHENKIGKGGFGEVYKGILSDGQEIAVKRLSKNSKQGAVEFKNEVLLIAKLQHRNLVTLLGFCLEAEEKILVYEYVPNSSLDYFLFGSQKRRVLNWSERYDIIKGIARGISYLHEHSRLKVIHRDLKPSNILLDGNMTPKISDFGLAKMVAIDETKGNTNRIAGTYGYMPPEYAMFGHYSEKSDVFSFGVMVLEIVSGKKNASCQESQSDDRLLNYAWKQWRAEKSLEILDSNMAELVSHNEVIKCIRIGLLCVQESPNVRPSMGTVVKYLDSDSPHLPFPQHPAFFYGHGASNSNPCSVNEMSLSTFCPR